ncbi:MAG: hypothetical protein K2Y27_21140 [Xanthobacteraceae bacterium]|nr:hypothetical protein [Xanthobacteraceae bacterium]
MTRSIILPLLGLLIGTIAAAAQSTSIPAECGDLSAVASHRRTIADARRVLSPAEVRCTLLETDWRLGRECERLKQQANADPEKRRAWANVVPAWSYLDRLLLAVRATEDRLGIECIPR